MMVSRQALGALVSLACLASPSVISADEWPRLLSTEWLAGKLSDSRLRVVDVRADEKEYWHAHIPGAIHLSHESLRIADRGVPAKLLPPEILAAILGKIGVDKETMVVAYDEKGSCEATYLVWALDWMGHSHSGVLEGGLSKWSREKRPLSQDYPQITPRVYLCPQTLHSEVRADLDEVRKLLAGHTGVLLDSRPVDYYRGDKGHWKRKGHIKGAISHCYADDIAPDGTWKSKDELLKLYTALGVTPDKTVVVSCGRGLRSSHSYFTLKHILGYPVVKNYDGGVNEWSSIEELPMEEGLR